METDFTDHGINRAGRTDRSQDLGVEVHYTTLKQSERPAMKTLLSNIEVGIGMCTSAMGKVKLKGAAGI